MASRPSAFSSALGSPNHGPITRGLSVTRSHEDVEILDVFAAAEPFIGDRRVALWRHPKGDLEFAAIGSSAELRAGPEASFEDAQRWCSEVAERFVGAVPAELPLIVGGFAFDPRAAAHQGSVWARWPRFLLVVPELLFYRHRGRTGVIFSEGASQRDLECAISRANAPVLPCSSLAALRENAADVFPAAVARATLAIERGDVDKVVLARQVEVRSAGGAAISPLDTARALRDEIPDSTAFMLSNAGECFVGATPEIIGRARGGRLTTVALAGTSYSGTDPLGSSIKERHEHDLVVDGILSSLAGVATDLTVADEPVVRAAGALRHFATPIEGRLLPGQTLLSAVAALHPTPALGGLPAAAARELRLELESFDRGYYGAPIGWLAASGDGCFSVAIRSALITRSSAYAYAGAGIVRGSDPQAELRETDAKLDTVCRRLRTKGSVS